MNKRKLYCMLSILIAVLMTGLYGVCMDNMVIKASEGTYTEKLTINDYYEKAPKPSDAQHKDWIFAGWYNDENCLDYIEDKTVVTGQKYAKFVPEDVLSVKCQNQFGVTGTSENTSLRLVTTVDSLYYREVGVDIIVDGKRLSVTTKKVYNKIKTGSGNQVIYYEAKNFGETSKYFVTVTLTNITQNNFNKGILIEPYWITPDGTKVYGISRYVRVEDSWENIINIPIRIYSDIEVAAGKIKVKYDTDKFSYLGTETGDIGTVFEEIYVADNGKGAIVCVGNTSMANDTLADGMFVSLRFKSVVPVSELSETFQVVEEEFANSKEQLVYTDIKNKLFDVSDVQYKTIK